MRVSTSPPRKLPGTYSGPASSAALIQTGWSGLASKRGSLKASGRAPQVPDAPPCPSPSRIPVSLSHRSLMSSQDCFCSLVCLLIMMTSTPAIEPLLLPGPIGIRVSLTTNLSLTRVGRLFAEEPAWNIAPLPATNMESWGLAGSPPSCDARGHLWLEDRVVAPLQAAHRRWRVQGCFLAVRGHHVSTEWSDDGDEGLVAGADQCRQKAETDGPAAGVVLRHLLGNFHQLVLSCVERRRLDLLLVEGGCVVVQADGERLEFEGHPEDLVFK